MTHFVVLTSRFGVPDSAVAEAREQLTVVNSVKRLSDIAVELAVDHAPGTLTALPQVDLSVVPAAARRKMLLIADMDSTIIPIECIDELGDFVGLKSKVAEITEIAMRGELDFEEALDARVALIKGLSRTDVERCYLERVTLNPGAEILVRTMRARGAMTALVSGGFTVFADRVGASAGFAYVQANRLEFENDQLTGTVERPIVTGQTKLDVLNRLTGEGGWEISETMAVGDGSNDALMVERAGIGVAYRAKPKLKQAANVCLDHPDLTALLSLQGIGEAEFVYSV